MDNTNKNTTSKFTALFKDRNKAEEAYKFALENGYTKEEINVFVSEETKKNFTDENLADSTVDSSMKGAGVGGAIGTTAGAIAAAIAAVGTTLTIPGLGLVISGPIAASLAGAGAGGIAGGIIGALTGMGVSQDAAEEYETALKEGGIVIGLTPHSEEERKKLESGWKNYGAIVK